MDLESVVRCLALRVGSTLRVWIFVLSVGLLVAGCGGGQSTASTGQVGAMSPEEEAFEACMEEAGYSIDDLDRGEPLTPEELEELGLEIGEGEEIYRGEPDWDLQLQMGTCINQSGIGESAVGDPEAIARRTESALALTRCMKDRGWSEFPDPVPHPAPYDDGLTHTRIDMPKDPEERDAFNADFLECAAEAEAEVSSDHDHDHDHD